MKKITLKNCDVKGFSSLIQRSSALDNFVFINVNGSVFESTVFNKGVNVLKSINANLEDYCDEFVNEFGDSLVKIQFTDSTKLIKVLNLAGSDNVDITFFIENNGYAKKMVAGNIDIYLTVPAADKEAIQFIEMPEKHRKDVFENNDYLQCRIGISETEFKLIQQLLNVNKEARRVILSIEGDSVCISEIESFDDNVRDEVNKILADKDIDGFNAYEKLYHKKISYDSIDKYNNDSYLRCFNKDWFDWIDVDKHYTIEFHTAPETKETRSFNKIKFVSVDEKGTKTIVVICPCHFV